MKTKFFRYAIMVLLPFFNYSCNNTCDKQQMMALRPDDVIDIEVIDPNGNNLLDSTNANSYNVDSIRIYRVFPDNTVISAHGKGNFQSSFKNGFRISYKSATIMELIIIDPSILPFNKRDMEGINLYDAVSSTTYIKWNSEDTDTVDVRFCQVYKKKCHRFTYINEVYYNNKLLFVTPQPYPYDGTIPRIRIIKNR